MPVGPGSLIRVPVKQIAEENRGDVRLYVGIQSLEALEDLTLANFDHSQPGPGKAIGLGHGMHCDHTLGLRFRDDALTMQFRRNLPYGFDSGKPANRSHVLVRKIVDHKEIILQTVLD